MASVLIVDDDPIFCAPFVGYMKKLGHQCRVAQNFSDGLGLAQEFYVDVVFLDVILPDANGLEGINNFIDAPSSPEIIIITGKSEISGAEMALKNGAWDYLEKPPSYDDVKLTLKRALQFRKNKIVFDAQDRLNTDFIIGENIKLKKCMDIVAKVIKTEGNLFITGETGTGKDLIAKAVHENSKRAAANFVTVDCTNLPDNLVESLLFGHLKGAFTGAVTHSDGLVKQADKGTLFLDEVGDLSGPAQKSILRVLQNKKYRPLGLKTEVECDFRLISATNRDLRKMVEEGRFRKDLYYRLVTYHIHLPPLRERLDDIKLLTRHYIAKICDQFGIHTKDVSRDFVETLILYDWKGNIRELISVLHSSIANAMNEHKLNPHHLPVEVRIYCRQKKMAANKSLGRGGQENLEMEDVKFPCLKEFRHLNESQYLDSLIKLSKGNIERACHLSGVSRSGLYHLLEKHQKKLKPL
ncbi:sigma-54-dependent transcriptional regulator [Desulfobacula toluolica]|uniref:Two component system response regulator, sigma54-specific n=1 Tax=Desulfobacula toluolica (strain DSM 7467 / Tol2) TaxID=651182 RepID=K0ND51_DESTT|nr:sigma-54 dependent transcriptional regulator [Desulfobacula toluolica]CCK78831.1 two component system response regulator, sigma54-specific [Desulfobacula toluolica Tol2]